MWLCGSTSCFAHSAGVCGVFADTRWLQAEDGSFSASASLAHARLWEVHTVSQRAGGRESSTLQGTPCSCERWNSPQKNQRCFENKFVIKIAGFLKQQTHTGLDWFQINSLYSSFIHPLRECLCFSQKRNTNTP